MSMFNQYINKANSTNGMPPIHLLSASSIENTVSIPSNTNTANLSGTAILLNDQFNNETTEEITEARSDATTTTINEQLVILTEEIKRLKEDNFLIKKNNLIMREDNFLIKNNLHLKKYNFLLKTQLKFDRGVAKMREHFNRKIVQKRQRADEAEQENDRLRTENKRLKKDNAELNERIERIKRLTIMGMLQYPNGYTYIGQLKYHEPHGNGNMIFRNKAILKSKNWNNGKCHGDGTMIWPSGDKYEGQFKNTLRNGKGTYYYPDGCKHVGEWKDNTKHGRGVFTFADGRKDEGEWKDDNKHGKFTVTMPDGSKFSVDYENNKEVSSTPIVTVDSSANPQ